MEIPRAVPTVPKILSRGHALVIAGLILILVAFGGLLQTSNTDATWTDQKTSSGSFRQAQFLGEIGKVKCVRDNTAKPNTINLYWNEPTDLQGSAVEYEVSWQDENHSNYRGKQTVNTTAFEDFFPLDFPAQHANLTFTIQARIPDTDLLGTPQYAHAEGPVGSGVVIRCGKG